MPNRPTARGKRRQSDLERLCGYLKNDSVIRWKLGCNQADIDAMRARIAARSPHGWAYLPGKHGDTDPEIEERQRRQRAKEADRKFKRIVKAAAGAGS